MRDTLVILDAGTIFAAQQICATSPDYQVYLFDPLLGDAAAAAGLRNVQLFSTLGGPSYTRADCDARAAAYALEAALDMVQRDSGSGISIAGWQHLNLYYVLMTLHWYTGLWERLGPRLREGSLHLFINPNPAEYYLSSFLPSLLLLSYLKRHNIAFKAYDCAAEDAPAYRIPDLRGSAPDDGLDYLLTHLPTCFYDIDYFCQELQATGKLLVNLEAKRWNVPITAQYQVGLTQTDSVFTALAPAQQDLVSAFTRLLRSELDRQLAAYIELPHYRARQVDHVARLYRSQLVTYFELQRFFRDTSPAKLLLSEHDAGFHGPLITFAEQRSLPVVMLPHSKVSADIEFSYSNIVVLTHPIQGRAIGDANGRSVENPRVSYPERFTSTSPSGEGLRTVSLLLNALSLNGIPFAPSDVYLDGIKSILGWCESNAVALKIRCKPGNSINGLLSVYLGLDPAMLARNASGSLDEHVRDCDLCLMYDLATTGALHLLRNSIPILNPLVTQQSAAQLSVVHADVIPPESLELTLKRLDGFKSDPLTLDAFRAAQFRSYIARFQDARPLRSYL
ncbi:MAG: hypothetical protein ACLPTF_16960 [Steroidobacteraceae bacterium]